MNWNQLQYVVTIAREKSITRAAKKLFIFMLENYFTNGRFPHFSPIISSI